MIKLRNLLLEYSESTIKSTIDRWKSESPKVTDDIARLLIQRFDQVKDSLTQRMNIIVLPDELKKNNFYLNIDKYSFNDMVRLINSIPESPNKIKKDAIQKFVEKERIDEPTARSYVNRFMQKKDDLKHALSNGLEERGLNKDEIKNLIPRNLVMQDNYLDPRNWNWEKMEVMLDALFPVKYKGGDEEGENTANVDANQVYNKNGIEIYKSNDVHDCITYGQKQTYDWCVSKPGNSNYNYYRLGEKSPTFYFVFDRNQSSEKKGEYFINEYHAFVIQVNTDGESYVVSNANNTGGDKPAKTWEDIKSIIGSETWEKIKGLKSYFKPIGLTSIERGKKMVKGNPLTLDEFKDLSQDDKILYTQGMSADNRLTKDGKATAILLILPSYKINYEGRSTTLMNVAIDSGQKIPYYVLKEYPALAKRYAVFRFRHTNYGKDPIPLPYLQYLDEPAKEKYLKQFDSEVTLEQIERFFGEKLAKEYVDKQLSIFSYLPQSATKYMDDKQKQLFGVYGKLFNNWKFDDNFNLSDEKLEEMEKMPEQGANPMPLISKQWLKLSSNEKKIIIALIKKYNNNKEIGKDDMPKYIEFMYAAPIVIENGNTNLILTPNDLEFQEWTLSEENGKIIYNNIKENNIEINNEILSMGYPSSPSTKLYKMDDLKIKSKDQINEQLKRMQLLAGL